MFEERPGLRGRPNQDHLTGYPSLAAAIMRDAAKHDRDWFTNDPVAVCFWCDVAGISHEALLLALDRWRLRQAEAAVEQPPVDGPAPVVFLSQYRADRLGRGD